MLNIKDDSRKVVKGDIFVALKGKRLDGHDYIEDAIKNGAVKVVCERGSYAVETIIVEDTKKYLDDYLVSNYSSYFKDIKLIGVTGTNGKTSTCFITYQILNRLNIKTCYIGTIGCYIDKDVIELDNTTPDILELYNLLINAKEKGCKVVVMEVSSHSLVQERIKGLEFSLCAFTNLTLDHLDYHKSMEEYLHAKLKIFNYLKDDGKIVINVDDKYSKYFMERRSVTLGSNDSDYKIIDYRLSNNNTFIKFIVNNDIYSVTTNLIGKFNIYNYLTSLALVNSLGINIKDIINVTDMVYAPKGRSEIIKYNKSIIVIDYAHTPDAVSKIINSFREVTNGSIITILGCGGDRDKSKRSIMGSISTNLSDIVIFTNDNPRTEKEDLIISDILKGVNKYNYTIIYDRKSAIKYGISLLNKDDTLLILGKGHEDYQILGNNKIHLSDYEEVITNIKK
mgnify:FL=1